MRRKELTTLCKIYRKLVLNCYNPNGKGKTSGMSTVITRPHAAAEVYLRREKNLETQKYGMIYYFIIIISRASIEMYSVSYCIVLSIFLLKKL